MDRLRANSLAFFGSRRRDLVGCRAHAARLRKPSLTRSAQARNSRRTSTQELTKAEGLSWAGRERTFWGAGNSGSRARAAWGIGGSPAGKLLPVLYRLVGIEADTGTVSPLGGPGCRSPHGRPASKATRDCPGLRPCIGLDLLGKAVCPERRFPDFLRVQLREYRVAVALAVAALAGLFEAWRISFLGTRSISGFTGSSHGCTRHDLRGDRPPWGALRKVAMIAYHARELARVLGEREPHEIALQAHFEGVLFAGISAEEKLVLALRSLVGGDVVADTSRLVRDLLDRQETKELGQRLARWLQSREEEKTLAEEARALRNAATHHFYDKRGGPRGEWHYEVEFPPGRFRSGLVLEFAEAYASHVGELCEIAETVAERWELQPQPAPVEA